MADKVVVDGELSMDTIIDGDLQLESQIKGETESVIKIEPKLEPITVSKNGMFLPSEGMDGFSSVTVDADIEDDYEWRKPEDWPDLESIELPGSWDTSTLYLLYDRSCGVDNVSVTCDGRVAEVYRGTVENGQFVGELIGQNVWGIDDTLTQDYTVYKIVTINRLALTCPSRVSWDTPATYSWSRQGCVWIYGEAPTATGGMFGNSGCSILNPWLRRIAILHMTNITGGFTFPANAFTGSGAADISVSFEIGKEEYGDWSGITTRRTGNGPVTPPIKQKSDYVVKNVTFNNYYEKGNICARNVVLINPHGLLFSGQYSYDQYVEKFVVIGGDLKARPTGMRYQFYFAYNIRTINLEGVDFSELTDEGSSFRNCYNLQYLKLNDTWAQSVTLPESPRLTRESILGLFNDLPEITTNKKITLHKTAKGRVTPEEIAIVTQKGWTVA